MHFLVKFLQMKMNLFSWSDHSVPFLTCHIKIKINVLLSVQDVWISSHFHFFFFFSRLCGVCGFHKREHFLFPHPLPVPAPALTFDTLLTNTPVSSIFISHLFFFLLSAGDFPLHVSFCLPEPVRTPRICPAGKCWVTGQAGCLLEF